MSFLPFVFRIVKQRKPTKLLAGRTPEPSVTLAANLEETYEWGQAIAKVLREMDKKVIFVSSGALAHNLVGGRHNMPTLSEHALIKSLSN
ncbi:hypothetical protein QFZ28_005865 [Neobacillus niacini]|uniref:DODA-type extradiol aromatic ring-opening family dioxygenase n=1 Tax=Neobacillus niacini TaxID=86668 RepID=UPI0027859761|nr:hypothetical protein [Neobacillus niacini]MDQ1005287.1 hypothetical protein [Neobacillus niacini]